MNKLKLQFAISIIITFAIGAAFGLYIASQIIGSFVEAR